MIIEIALGIIVAFALLAVLPQLLEFLASVIESAIKVFAALLVVTVVGWLLSRFVDTGLILGIAFAALFGGIITVLIIAARDLSGRTEKCVQMRHKQLRRQMGYDD